MGLRAAEYGKKMLWPEVAKSYLATFEHAIRDHAYPPKKSPIEPAALLLPAAGKLPELKLNHLFDLSDDTGILQHATFNVVNRREGYCVDDNARALLLTAYLDRPDLDLLQGRYLSFLLDAYNPHNGRFRNFMSYRRDWLEDAGSEDSHGRSLWALGALVRRCPDSGRRSAARALFRAAYPAILTTISPRTWAYGVLAADEYLRAGPDEFSARPLLQTLASRLWRQFEIYQAKDWPWFEDSLTYANARLPQALILAGETLSQPDMARVGLNALAWLMEVQKSPNGDFAPIGTEQFYVRGSKRSYYDQQPLEAWASVSACLSASKISKDPIWMAHAMRAFRWFLGKNMLGRPVYDEKTGGCHDGLHPDRLNRNQGAESTLSFLCALSELQNAVPTKRERSNATDGNLKADGVEYSKR